MPKELIEKAIVKRNGLIFKSTYGNNAQDTYDACCSTLGFDSSLRGRFGGQKDLYAEKATKEGYSVWLIIHSNLVKEQNNKNHMDTISRDYSRIEEKFFIDPPKTGYVGEKRVVFARSGEKDGMFVFIGIFEMDYSTEDKMLRTYKKIEDNYNL